MQSREGKNLPDDLLGAIVSTGPFRARAIRALP